MSELQGVIVAWDCHSPYSEGDPDPAPFSNTVDGRGVETGFDGWVSVSRATAAAIAAMGETALVGFSAWPHDPYRVDGRVVDGTRLGVDDSAQWDQEYDGNFHVADANANFGGLFVPKQAADRALRHRGVAPPQSTRRPS
ncbi:MAG: hypothetical protein EXR79_15340 [Myxococcales bacterium]|nr:hypothetical protein [Myxococcales bacterium]